MGTKKPEPESLADQPLVFRRSWWSSLGVMLLTFLILTAVFLVVALVSSGGERWLFVGIAGFMALMCWFMGRVFFGRLPYLQIDANGMGGSALKGKSLAWSEVANMSLMSTQGHAQLCVDLRLPPGAPLKRNFIGLRNDQLIVPLSGLAESDHSKVLEAASQAFRRISPAAAARANETNQEADKAELEFEQRLVEHTPNVWAVPVITALCFLVWIAGAIAGVGFWEADAAALYRWGGNSASAVQAGQWWRLVSAMFLHGGMLHLLINMYALWEAGVLVSRLYGNRGFLLIYFATGIAGSALSLHFGAQTSVSVGASGAIFGVAGALLAAVIEHRGKFPPARSKQLLAGLSVFILFSLLNGFARAGIDNAAHVGGLVMGLLLGWLMVEKIDDTQSAATRRNRLWMAGLLSAVLATAVAVRAPAAQFDLGRYFTDLKIWTDVQPQITSTMAAIREDWTAAKAGKLTPADRIERMRKLHLPALRSIESQLAGLQLPAEIRAGKLATVQKHYFDVRSDLMEAEILQATQPSAENRQEIQKLTAAAEKAANELRKLNEESSKEKSTR